MARLSGRLLIQFLNKDASQCLFNVSEVRKVRSSNQLVTEIQHGDSKRTRNTIKTNERKSANTYT